MRNIETRRRKRTDGSVLVNYRVRWVDDTGDRQPETFYDLGHAQEFRDQLEESAQSS